MEFFNFDGDVLSRLASLFVFDASSPMTLTSGLFLFVFLIFGAGYLLVRRHITLRTLYVVLFSLYFYYKLSGLYLLLLLFVGVSDFMIGRRVAQCLDNSRSARGWVALSVVINVAILTYFTATNFFVDTINGIYGEGTLDVAKVVKPAGVSFFVFQSLAYVIDISRGSIKPLRRFRDYLFLLAFFPKVLCGPLVRAKDFIQQMQSPTLPLSREDLGRAVKLIAAGLLKFSVIATVLGQLFVRPAFAGELGDGGLVALLAVYGFTLQIYCDFSGISDIAVGVALLMGFHLPDNFDAPYKSATITEFWRRWHISLSSWLRDYLYISLGGNRKGRFRTYLNLFLTMFLGGLWHGVSLCYVAWGMLHGIALALHKVWLKVVPNAKSVGEQMRPLVRVPATILTFHIVAFGWLLFASAQMFPGEDIAVAGDIMSRIANNFSFAEFAPLVDSCAAPLALMAFGYILHLLPRRMDRATVGVVTRSGFVGQWLVIVVMIWLVMQTAMLLAADVGAGGGLPMYGAY